MLFKPKETKFTKYRKGKKYNKISKTYGLHKIYGSSQNNIKLIALNHARITEAQMAAIRATALKKLKKKGNIYFRILADVPLSKKPLEIRMGKGKGAINSWIAKVSPGMCILELGEVTLLRAFKILKEVRKKLPIATRVDIL